MWRQCVSARRLGTTNIKIKCCQALSCFEINVKCGISTPTWIWNVKFANRAGYKWACFWTATGSRFSSNMRCRPAFAPQPQTMLSQSGEWDGGDPIIRMCPHGQQGSLEQWALLSPPTESVISIPWRSLMAQRFYAVTCTQQVIAGAEIFKWF